MKVDCTSDLHFDMHVKINNPEYKQEKDFNVLFERIIPENNSDILLISGDLGHYNFQNEFALTILRKWYKHILFVAGNHDLYLVSQSQSNLYHHDSFERLIEMKELANKIEGVHFLDGNTVEIEGKVFGGTGMWYDFQYGIQIFGKSIQELSDVWEVYMNDANLIRTTEGRIKNLEYFKSEYSKLEKIYQKCDVILTHVGPDWSMIEEKYKDISTSFYYFDGKEMLKNCFGKTWLYGHTHLPASFNVNGCHLICNPLGYPKENPDYMIKTIEV